MSDNEKPKPRWMLSLKLPAKVDMPKQLGGDLRLSGIVEEGHILPIDDRQEHSRELSCPCRPCPILLDDHGIELPYPIVVHNAFDGREHLEKPITFKP